MSDRPMRGCKICGGYDDHPRHVQSIGGQVTMAHMDCCAAAGCETCIQTEADNGGRRGADLTAYLTSNRGA